MPMSWNLSPNRNSQRRALDLSRYYRNRWSCFSGLLFWQHFALRCYFISLWHPSSATSLYHRPRRRSQWTKHEPRTLEKYVAIVCLSSLGFHSQVTFKSDQSQRTVSSFVCCQVYAWINGGSGFLQFGILPLFLGRMGHQTQHLWLLMPIVVTCAALWMVCKMKDSGMDGLFVDAMTASFCILKVLEYSLRGVLIEMVRSACFEISR